MKYRIKQFITQAKGAIAIEFALVIPLFIILLYGTVEMSNFLYAHQKLQNVAYNMLNIMSNDITRFSQRYVNFYGRISDDILRPFEPIRRGMYVSVLKRDHRLSIGLEIDEEPPGPYIRCHYRFMSGGVPSRFDYAPGAEFFKEANRITNGGEEVNGFMFGDGDQLIAVEFHMRYTPIIDVAIVRQMLGMRGPRSEFMQAYAQGRSRTGNARGCDM